jgi:membrane protein DedA with SNARE-associated domain
MPTLEFAALNALGAIAWAILIGGAGYLFGQVVMTFLERAREAEEVLFIVAAAATLVGLIAYRRWRRKHAARAGAKARA